MNADKKEAIKGVKKAMVKTMTLANQIPHFSYCDEYNMSELVNLRAQLKHIGKERGVSLSYLPILIKVSNCPACPLLLKNRGFHVTYLIEGLFNRVALFPSLERSRGREV